MENSYVGHFSQFHIQTSRYYNHRGNNQTGLTCFLRTSIETFKEKCGPLP